MLSCSTCWNSDRQTDGEAMLEEILALGFRNIELGHGIRLSLMEGIQRVFDKGRVKFSSLHNFCPLPLEITRSSPDCYQYSSHRDTERERAVKLTLQTIDFAARLGARFVVLHLGRVPMDGITHRLTELAAAGELYSREYVEMKIKAVQEREEKGPLYIRRAKECLEPIVEYAASKNIRLCVESRQGYEEVPNEREMPGLLDEIDSPFVGYWHDFGHVQIKHNLGFLDHFEWLSKIRGRLFGCHLHDVVWPGQDHRPPFTGGPGGVAYDKLIPLLPKDTLFVWEMGPRRKAEDISASLEKWKAHFGVNDD
jgi:sugar phosphate isomerase/epimerase